MFYLYKEELVLAEDKITLPSLKAIIKKYNKKEASARCLYVFLVSDRTDDNPMKGLDILERYEYAVKVALEDNGLALDADEMVELNKVATEYSVDNLDKAQRSIDLYDEKMAQFRRLLVETTPEIYKNEHELTGKVTFSTNIVIITNILENVIKIIIDRSIMSGMKKSGKFVRSLRGKMSPNTRGRVTQMKD